ncbi:E3 ubiquitin-protein ligase BRE1 [Grifola frondosa]|uniref:E3 ubiquitin protein ligase n=1 Tax=Grifola frondosa TaxID=5627 RepID=A0A1C7LRE8_GRIFR|nr:E3 ubiquitin-protein ligase BRE1 [Grifola frondosa]
MESRKRPHAEDIEHTQSKKRALSDEHGSPSHLNGSASHPDEPNDGDNLEMFRKDAIYRRMKYYSREHERSQARVADLERRRSTCEAGLAALEACWTQIIGTIRLLVKPEDLAPIDKHAQELFDLTAHVSSDSEPDYVNALRDKMQATSDLVTAFVRLSSQGSSASSNDEMYKQCQQAQTECSSLRSELSLVRTRLRDVESEKEQFHEELVAAEKRVDRLQSRALSSIQTHPVKAEVMEDSPQETPSSPAPPQVVVNGTHSEDINEWHELAKVREGHIEDLIGQNAALQQEVHSLKLQLRAPSEEFIVESSYYRLLQERASKLEHSANESQQEVTRLREEVEQLQASRQEFENSIITANEQGMQELRIMLTKRDNENLRLREQRDQQLSELNERKQKDSVKLASAHEHKALAESRLERINVLELELTRLKTRLAANAGDEDLMSFLFKDQQESSSYVDDLKQRLSTAEERARSLEKSLSSLQEKHPDVAQHVKNEAQVRQQLAEVQKQLEKYRIVYGDASSLPAEAQSLSEQLQQKQSEIEKLQLQEKQRGQAESALYSELDKLSAAWEALDRQVKSKVFELTAMEERLTKIGLDRAKSENKFYSAMRDKEAIETERKNISRNLEKQAKVVEKLSETEKILTTRLTDLEKEIVQWKRALEAQKERTSALESDVTEWKTRSEAERKRSDEMRGVFQEHERVLERKRSELRKMEEGLVRTKKEAEKVAAKIKATPHTSSNSKEAQLQSEIDKCMHTQVLNLQNEHAEYGYH